MKVLLVTSRSNEGFNIAPPLGLYRLKHYLNENAVDCDILDLDLESEEQYLKKIAADEYDIIGVSVSHWKMKFDLELTWKIQGLLLNKIKPPLLIAGGQEATLNYSPWMDVGFDVIVTGFGEKVLCHLCQLWEKCDVQCKV